MRDANPVTPWCRHDGTRPSSERRVLMLMTIAIVLLVLWLLGLVTGTLLGGFIYVLLVIAVVLFLVQVITGRRAA